MQRTPPLGQSSFYKKTLYGNLEISVRNQKSRTPKLDVHLKNEKSRTLRREVNYPSLQEVFKMKNMLFCV